MVEMLSAFTWSSSDRKSGNACVWVGEGPAGGGDDGGVEVDKIRCRCTSPRNTLPMWAIRVLDAVC